jgi:hypothetical protein
MSSYKKTSMLLRTPTLRSFNACSMKITMVFLAACQMAESQPPAASLPASSEVTDSLNSPNPLNALNPPDGEKTLWPFCDDAEPGRGFCLTLWHVRQIRAINKKKEAAWTKRWLDEKERADKLAVRNDAANAGKVSAVVIPIVIGVLAAGAGIGIGYVVGSQSAPK